ncbi:unnamed protein product [Cylindrotheca closterium]|uniref:Uncharacterized protein n=1 Tax=Cylindrotheca closterium TaxID=2856 RepID=A0AAD2JN19_9STRA|nr:unnamed protein product [Cylindrotheca closterium]
MSSRPRRKHKLRHPTGATPPHSPFAQSSSSSTPFSSPLRFTPKKSLLRISSPKATKSPRLSSSKLARMMLPGSLPLDGDTTNDTTNNSKENVVTLPFDDSLRHYHHQDESYPEVPKTPVPEHKKLLNGDGDGDGDLPDDISSVSSGSKNGKILVTSPDEKNDDKSRSVNGSSNGGGEEWEYKQFTGTATTPKRSKMGKLLGKHKRRFMFRKKKKNATNPSSSGASAGGHQEQQQQPSETSFEMQQSQSRSLPSLERQQLSLQDLDQLPQEQPRAPPPAPQRQQQQPRPPRQPMLSPIRIKRQRKVQPQSNADAAVNGDDGEEQDNDDDQEDGEEEEEESPRKTPRRILIKGRHRAAAAKKAVRSDALWTQTILIDSSSSSADEEAKEQVNDKHDDDDNNKEEEEEDIPMKDEAEKEEESEGSPLPITTPQKGEEKEQENVKATLATNDSGNAPINANTTVDTPDTVRSDSLWAQNMMLGGDDQNDDADSYDNILTPEAIMSPKTMTTASPATIITSTALAASKIPNLEEHDEQDENNENGEKNDNDKMDTRDTISMGRRVDSDRDDTTRSSRTMTSAPGEDGNIVDEDDLLDLVPSDEQEDHDDNDDDDDQYGEEKIVEEKDNNSTDGNYYLQQILSDDEDDEGGVVSEHDEELILEEQNNSRRGPRSGSFDDGDLILSDILSRDGSASFGIGPTDEESNGDNNGSVAGQDNGGIVSAPQSPVLSEIEMDKDDQHHLPVHQHPEICEEPLKAAIPENETVAENVNTSFDSNFTLNDSDLADMEKEKPLSISDRSSMTNMQHRLLSMRTIKDTYKKKLLLQEQETEQLQLQLLASQYEAREAKMSIQASEMALANERSKLRASENDREQQKALLLNLREQLSIVQSHLNKSQLKREDGPARSGDHSEPPQTTSALSSSSSYDMKLASMEEQLLVQDEEMDQLAMQIQDLKGKTAELEVSKREAEQKWKEALAREKILKEQLVSLQMGQQISNEKQGENGSDQQHHEIQRLEELIRANEERYQSESVALRQQLENVQKDHESELSKLREAVELNQKLVDSSQKEAQVAQTKLLQELAEAKLEHARTIEELKESLSSTHEQEKRKLHTQYSNELERLEDEIAGSRSELSV